MCKLIVVYGVNGVGKTTQAFLLREYLCKIGYKTCYLKYPIYDLEPEGPIINKYLRDKKFRVENKMTAHEFQELCIKNRERHKPILEKIISENDFVIIEDYVGTSLAWGLAWGGNFEYLESINKPSIKEDLCILLNGSPRKTPDKNHCEKNIKRIKACKSFFVLLSEKYDWKTINSQSKKVHEIQQEIVCIIEKTFKLKPD